MKSNIYQALTNRETEELSQGFEVVELSLHPPILRNYCIVKPIPVPCQNFSALLELILKSHQSIYR